MSLHAIELPQLQGQRRVEGVRPKFDFCTGAENPYEKGTSMGLLRAESIRTCRELGYVTDGDRVVSVDRALGKAHDAFAVAQTLKIYTVSAEGGEI